MTSDEVALHGLMRVLVVDDDIQLLRGLTISLSHEGYEVTTVSSGARVLDAIAQVDPHVVLLDVMMPGIDGWEVLRRIRANASTINLPVLMLTAKDSEDAKVHGFSLGADDYLTKPFSIRELRCRVAALLRRTASAEQAPSESVQIPVTAGSSGFEFVESRDVFYIEGIRNYTYVHTYDGRHLSRLSLGDMERRVPDTLMRVHRSYIVNLDHVHGCRWATRSSYHLVLADVDSTEIPVSRMLVSEVEQRLNLK
ncbi:MAG: response regulator [Anaerosomatales bacterium]|nr:response regulator [Anaerosomatales bacterium]MDT8434419.1 response regulator [Anaerosomatales bacterium]